MSAPCQHDPPQSATCRLCFLYLNDPRYKALWDGEPLPPRDDSHPPPRPKTPPGPGKPKGPCKCGDNVWKQQLAKLQAEARKKK